MTTNFMRLRALQFILLTALLMVHFAPLSHADNLTKLYSFSYTFASGSQPIGKLLQAPDGYFYGTTQQGGEYTVGTIFRLSKRGTVTTLYSFDHSATGCHPYGGLLRDTDGAFYGTTYDGGVNGSGGVYKMTLSNESSPVATVTPYYSFKGYDAATPASSEPATPYYGELIKGSDGKLYGTTLAGGVNNNGAVYSLSIVGNGTPTLSLLYSFNAGAGNAGYSPYSGVTEGNDGKLYGTAYSGGANGYGVVYSLTRDGATYADVHDFASRSDGANPMLQLTKSSSGDLYGVTQFGGSSSDGTLYKVSSSGVYAELYSFDGNAGQYPNSQPIFASDGSLYGTTRAGGSLNNAGVVYKYDLAASAISVFSTFDGIDGYYPNALTQGVDKNFYGTSQFGGVTSGEAGVANGSGSAFKISNSGMTSLLYSFHISPGYYSHGRILQGPDGQFYGVTSFGGDHLAGTIFKINAHGNFTVLHHFNDSPPLYEGAYPFAGLIVGKDGCLYGSTSGGGFYGNGTIYKITTAGVYTIVYSLKENEGSGIVARLLLDKDGSFYGVCSRGGANNYGTAFKLSGAKLTVLHQFSNVNGQAVHPNYGLTQDKIGNLYSVTFLGGTDDYGTIYELNKSGTRFNTVYSFVLGDTNGIDGFFPSAALLYKGGAMYGTTALGGTSGDGTIFKFTPSTTSVTLNKLHDFNSATDGSDPHGGLSLGPEGKLYGTTGYGSPGYGGTVYRFDMANNFTTLYSFDKVPTTRPNNPLEGVIVGSDNNLYLTTYAGGDFYGAGTIATIDISLHFAVKVSNSVTVTLGALTFKNGNYDGLLTVTNTGNTTILGPVNVVLTGLTGGTTLVNKTGDVPSSYTETGSPYIQANPTGSAHGIFALGAGKSITIPVHFSANTGISAVSQTYLRRF